MSSAALSQPNVEAQSSPSLSLPLKRSGKERIRNLDGLLLTPMFEQSVSLPEDLASASMPPPGMITALRVCLFVQGGLLLVMAVAYEVWRATHY